MRKRRVATQLNIDGIYRICVKRVIDTQSPLNESGVNPTNLYFLGNKEFFRFLLISLTIPHKYTFFPFLQTHKLNSENRKTGK